MNDTAASNRQAVLRNGLTQYIGAMLDKSDYKPSAARQLIVAALLEEAVKICKRLAIDDLPSTKSGAVIIKFRDDDELVACTLVEEEDTILLATANGMAMRTRASNVRVMGRNATGSTGIKFKYADDHVVSAIKANDDDIVLIVAENGIGKRMKASEIRLLANKGGKGVTYYRPNRKTGSVVNVLEVKEGETVFAVTQQGMIIRLPASR